MVDFADLSSLDPPGMKGLDELLAVSLLDVQLILCHSIAFIASHTNMVFCNGYFFFRDQWLL